MLGFSQREVTGRKAGTERTAQAQPLGIATGPMAGTVCVPELLEGGWQLGRGKGVRPPASRVLVGQSELPQNSVFRRWRRSFLSCDAIEVGTELNCIRCRGVHPSPVQGEKSEEEFW